MSEFRNYRQETFPPIVKNLIIINVLVFVAQLIFRNLTYYIGLWPVGYPFFRPYQVVTHMFSHSPTTLGHIFFNMFSLWLFGRVLESVWGGKRFLFFYLASGLGAAAFHLLIQYLTGSGSLTVGASGAIMGVIVAFAYLFPNTELYLLFIPFPIKAKWLAIAYVAIDLFSGIANAEGDNVAHFAHLGGAITGFILVLIWNKSDRQRFY
jgi:rhomboid-like protein